MHLTLSKRSATPRTQVVKQSKKALGNHHLRFLLFLGDPALDSHHVHSVSYHRSRKLRVNAAGGTPTKVIKRNVIWFTNRDNLMPSWDRNACTHRIVDEVDEMMTGKSLRRLNHRCCCCQEQKYQQMEAMECHEGMSIGIACFCMIRSLMANGNFGQIPEFHYRRTLVQQYTMEAISLQLGRFSARNIANGATLNCTNCSFHLLPSLPKVNRLAKGVRDN